MPNFNQNLLSSDKIPEISIDAEVTNLVQIKMEKSVYFAFLTCAAFFDEGGAIMRMEHRVVARALCFAITILSIHYHQFNLTAHFALLQERRLSIRSNKLFWQFAVKLNL